MFCDFSPRTCGYTQPGWLGVAPSPETDFIRANEFQRFGVVCRGRRPSAWLGASRFRGGRGRGDRFSLRVLNASDFGVCQLRPRFVCVALRPDDADTFLWPDEEPCRDTVGDTLIDLMSANGWPGALSWSHRANAIAPTIVGGSKKHGGPDLGPTRAKR